MTDTDGHFLHEKGITGERLLQELATKSFFVDWCFNNPKWPDNKKEICDLFVLFDDTVILWSVKNCKLDKNGNYRKSDIEESNGQLSGAYRKLFKLRKKVPLENPSGGKEYFYPEKIKHVHLISVLAGDEGDFLSCDHIVHDHHVHTFDRRFLQVILQELNTISDFCKYLREKEKFLDTAASFILEGGEEELLAHYLLNNRSINVPTEEKNIIIFSNGTWQNYIKSDPYKRKKKADKISTGWDEFIEKGREYTPASRKIAMALARPSRLERRDLSEIYFDCYSRAAKSQDGLYEFSSSNDVTYCFLFFDEPPGQEGLRKSLLREVCLKGKAIFPQNDTVIGIASAKTPEREWTRDFCMKESWSKEELNAVDRIKKNDTGMKDIIIKKKQNPEYPD